MKRHQNLILMIAVVLLAIFPLWLVERPAPAADGERAEIFAGADDQAKNAISEIAPDYQPWFEPLLEPASGEIASLLFALQAAIGAGFIGYYLGVSRTREKMRRAQQQEQTAGESNAADGGATAKTAPRENAAC